MSDYDTVRSILDAHLSISTSGKVRDSYELPDGKCLVVVSDRASIFDIKLGFPIPGKGEALNASNIAARLFLRRILHDIEDDLVAFGPVIDEYLPRGLWYNSDLHRRATVVKVLGMEDVECVVRGNVTGSAYKTYKAGKPVCGHVLPGGLVEGSPLIPPVFTPTTKAVIGHDEPLDYLDVRKTYGGELEDLSLIIFQALHAYSLMRGVIGVDTKFEFGRRPAPDSPLILADEVWTPDSSRFWSRREYEENFPQSLPSPLDKQELRNWGKKVGIDTLDPKNLEDVARGRKIVAPPEVITKMQKQIHLVFEMLWGMSIATFQRDIMKIYH